LLHRRSTGVLAGLIALVLAGPAQAAGPAKVTVRAEGVQQTLIPRVAVTTTTTPVNKSGKPGEECTGTSAAGALEIASGGDWTGSFFGGSGYFVETIKGETPAFPLFFTFWLNNRESPVGICSVELQEGDDVLFFVARCDFDGQTCTNPPVLPLGLKVPATASPGSPFNVEVVEFATNGTPSPVAGAIVTGGSSPATTDANGVAAVTLTDRGAAGLRATKPNRAASATETVCATDGADGFCGTTKPGDPPATVPPCTTTGDDGLCGTRDRRAPQGRVVGISEGQRFARGRGPRELRGLVAPDPSGLQAVKLRLTRRVDGRCSYYSPKTETLRRSRCGRSFAFGIGDRAEFSYLLPKRLPRGRYVLDVVAIDKAFNRDPLARGRNRVVFTVS